MPNNATKSGPIWRKSLFFLTIVASLSACQLLSPTAETAAVALRDGSYRLDPDHATLLFKIRHFGISTYVGRFNRFDASLEFDEENPEMSSLEAIIDVNSLDVNNPSFAETLTGSAWFDAENHPQATFRSTDITITGDNTGQAIGELTIKGVTQPATIEITFNGGTRNPLNRRYTIGFDATTSFSRSDFGIDRYGGFVGDRVRLEFYGEFQRQ